MTKLSCVVVVALLAVGCSGDSPTRPSPTVVTFAPAPAPTPAPTPAPAPLSFSGVWTGRGMITGCFDDGVFEGACQTDSPTQYSFPLTLTLVQSATAVSGTAEWYFLRTSITGTATGTNLTNVRGRASVSATRDGSFEDWNTTISGNTMAGTFAVRQFARQTGVGGSVRVTIALEGVTRTP